MTDLVPWVAASWWPAGKQPDTRPRGVLMMAMEFIASALAFLPTLLGVTG
ncbi:MAG TPA: hypothetical protein VHW64_03710 [Nocardioides sp.]|nr:hypothetical protein [Nocardioides sp.]HEX3929782.1 hypothetical protein [Nocardioides sp.]